VVASYAPAPFSGVVREVELVSSPVEVAIIGAGPYGLSVAAQLGARAVPFRIFGQPMRTWRPMPRSLCLKSLGFATSIAVPGRGYDFPGWLAQRGLETLEPISYADFTDYGLWVQQRCVPDVEPVDVSSLRRARGGGYELVLADGQLVRAARVVVATGLHWLQHLPELLAPLPAALVSHTFGQYDFRRWAGKEVAVIGAGQSALEVSVLLQEVGAHPVLIAQHPPLFHGRTARNRPWTERVREPLTVLGAGRLNWVLEHLPWLVRHAPEERRVRFARGYLGPSGAWWLRDRFEGRVPVLAPAAFHSAAERGESVVLRFSVAGGAVQERAFAHVVCGTGFRHSVERLPFLEPALLASLGRIAGLAPRLSRHFESTLPGLYFVGPLSAYAFGPLFRFVCGATPAAPVVARHLARRRARIRPVRGTSPSAKATDEIRAA